MTRDALDSLYRGAWSPPVYFAWDGLTFDSLDVATVAVSGRALWQGARQVDTTVFEYAAVVVAVDSGLAIVFEHETRRR